MLSPELFEALKSGGAALVPFLGLLWWMERAERLKEREEHKTVAKDMITAMVKTEATLATLGKIFTAGKLGE
jgi:threonine/homoserine/homoserine lactone efflux protein